MEVIQAHQPGHLSRRNTSYATDLGSRVVVRLSLRSLFLAEGPPNVSERRPWTAHGRRVGAVESSESVTGWADIASPPITGLIVGT